MGTHMKTTIEVSDALFTSVKNFAKQRQTTLRAMVEEGLRRVMADGDSSAKPAFKLTDASVKGKQMLLSDPRRWQEMEQDHVIERVARPRR
jgi:hypothetical protein